MKTPEDLAAAMFNHIMGGTTWIVGDTDILQSIYLELADFVLKLHKNKELDNIQT